MRVATLNSQKLLMHQSAVLAENAANLQRYKATTFTNQLVAVCAEVVEREEVLEAMKVVARLRMTPGEDILEDEPCDRNAFRSVKSLPSPVVGGETVLSSFRAELSKPVHVSWSTRIHLFISSIVSAFRMVVSSRESTWKVNFCPFTTAADTWANTSEMGLAC